MLKCTDWNMCNILQFSHSVNIHFKQPYWNGTIWKPYFMCQRGDLPEYWLFFWTDVPTHPDFSYGWLFASKRILFWMEMDPSIPLEVELCWRGLHFMGELLQELQLLPDIWFCPIAGEHVNLKLSNWVFLGTLYVVLMKITCLLHESRPVEIQQEKWS